MTLSLAALMAMPAISFAQNSSNEKKTVQTATCCKANGKGECKEGCKPDCKNGCSKACTPENKAACNKDGKCKDGKNCQTPCNNNKECKNKKGNFCKGDRHHGNHRKGDMHRRPGGNPLMKGITLTPQQQEKVKALKASRQDDRKKQMDSYNKEMEKILTPDQLKIYKANMDSMKNNRPAKRMDRR